MYAKHLPCLLPPCANRENLEGVEGVVIPGSMPGLDCWLAGTFGNNGAQQMSRDGTSNSGSEHRILLQLYDNFNGKTYRQTIADHWILVAAS